MIKAPKSTTFRLHLESDQSGVLIRGFLHWKTEVRVGLLLPAFMKSALGPSYRSLPPGSYRIVGYNPQPTGSGNFTLTYSSPLS